MIHTIRQILNGQREISNTLKYQMISGIIACVHFVFLLFFYKNQIQPLFIYNIFVVLFYSIMVVVIGKSQSDAFVFLSAFVEILFHSVFASLMVGWDCGFMLYTVALIPMGFYMSFTLPYMKKKISTPIVLAAIVTVIYFSTMGITMMNEPFYPRRLDGSVAQQIYVFNSLMTCMYLWIVALLFSIEIKFMQYHLEEENVSLSRMANYDTLTRLLNRRSMNVQLKQIMDETEESGEDGAFCLIMADIDDFKKVNDTYGHSVGDEVLIEVARVLQSNVREEDRVCRWGGEEMLIMLRSNMEVARNVAQRICSDMEATLLQVDDKEFSVTLTIGVSEYKKGESIRSMIETADQRLYRGKHSGKNCVVWN